MVSMWCLAIFRGLHYTTVISVVYFEWCHGVISKGIYVVTINLSRCDGYFRVVYWNIKYGTRTRTLWVWCLLLFYWGFFFIQTWCPVLFVYVCVCVMCVCVVFFVSFLFFLTIISTETTFIRYKWPNCNLVIHNWTYCKQTCLFICQ